MLLFVLAFLLLPAHAAEDLNARIQSIEATTSVAPLSAGGRNYTFGASNLLDGNLQTCWQEAAEGHGVGQRVTVRFKGPVDIGAIDVATGFQWRGNPTFGDLYDKNGRVTALALAANGGPEKLVDVVDRPGYQTLPITLPKTTTLTLEIRGVAPGAEWPDTALSELRFWSAVPAGERDDFAAMVDDYLGACEDEERDSGECFQRYFNQACFSGPPPPCVTEEMSCQMACSDPCKSCQSSCADTCGVCKVGCGDDAGCLRRCAEVRALCREQCFAVADTCAGPDCKAHMAPCWEKARAAAAELAARCPQCDAMRTCLAERRDYLPGEAQTACKAKFPYVNATCWNSCQYYGM